MECGMWDMGCGMWDVDVMPHRCAIWDVAHISYIFASHVAHLHAMTSTSHPIQRNVEKQF